MSCAGLAHDAAIVFMYTVHDMDELGAPIAGGTTREESSQQVKCPDLDNPGSGYST